MLITTRNTYHPFVNKSLGFLINSKGGTYSKEFLFEDINLHWQPVHDPKIGALFLVIYFLIILVGGFVQYHLWQMLKRGDSLVSRILKAYVIVEVTVFPIICFFNSANNFMYPLSDIFGSWLCVVVYFLTIPGMVFINFHTTIIAVMRYFFIVHDERVASFGKERAEHLFYWILGIVPILMTVWLYFGAANRDFDGFPAMNKCNGSYDKIFLLKWGFAERAISPKIFNRSVWTARCDKQNTNESSTSSAVELLDLIQCRASSVVFSLLFLNVSEGFIYYRTWTHILKK